MREEAACRSMVAKMYGEVQAIDFPAKFVALASRIERRKSRIQRV
jgi:hypothetical protein